MNLGKTPMPVEASVDRPVVISVFDGDSIYYARQPLPTSADTSVAKGSAVTFTSPAWAISAGTSVIYRTDLYRPTYDQANLTAATITTATVSALTGLADATFTNNTALAAHNKSIFYDGTTLVFRISASTVTADLF